MNEEGAQITITFLGDQKILNLSYIYTNTVDEKEDERRNCGWRDEMKIKTQEKYSTSINDPVVSFITVDSKPTR